MIVGFILALLINFVIFMIYLMFGEYSYDDNKFGIIILLLIIQVTGTIFGIYEDNIEYKSYVETYKATEKTYNEAFNNANINDLEKISFSSKAIEYNQELAQKKVRYFTWYYWYIDKSELNDLKPISLGGQNNEIQNK